MLLLHTLFKKAGEVLFGGQRAKNAQKKRTRTLRIEELESRELLSATPLDWDWNGWWDSFSANNVQVDPLPAGYNTDSGLDDFGQISFGGNSVQVEATSKFVPNTISNFTAFDDGVRNGNATVLNGNGDPIVGYNSETIMVGIVSQDLGNGNWTYTEASTYTYSITSDGNAYWGGYSYVFAASSINNIYESTFVLTTEDSFTINETITSATSESPFNLTTITTGGAIETIVTTHFHDTLLSEHYASDIRTTVESTTYTGTGTYSYAVAGGSVSGTIGQSGVHVSETSVEMYMVDTGNGWETTGTQSALITESSSSTSQGNGGYNTPTNENGYSSQVSGTITESGSTSETLMLVVSGVLNNGDWSMYGSGTTTSTSGDSYSHVSSGSYNQSVFDPGNSLAVSGTHSGTMFRTNDSSGCIQLSLANGTWEISGGTNGTSGQLSSTFQYSENGSFLSSESGNDTWSNSGTFSRSGDTADASRYAISSTYLLGKWQTTGTGCGSGCENSYYSYANTGTYTSAFSKDDGSSFAIGGTSSQSGYDQSSMTYQTQSILLSDGSWLDSGGGCEAGSSYEESSYTGSGSFTMAIDNPSIAGSASYLGSANHDGDSSTSSTWNAIWLIQNSIWSRTSGSGVTINNNRTHLDFDGYANTIEDYTQGEVSYETTSLRSTNGSDDDQSQTTLNLYIVNGDWEVLSGSGTSCGASYLYHDFETEGCYSSCPSGVTGSFSSSGHDEIDSTSALQLAWNGAGWNATGTINYDSTDSLHIQQNGSGTITSGTMSNTRTESFAENSETKSSWKECLNANGSTILLSGSSSSKSDYDQEWTIDGTGTFDDTSSTGDGGALVASGDAVTKQKGTSTGKGTESYVVINNAWKLNGGTFSGTDTEYNKSSKSGTGMLTKGSQSCEVTITQWDETDVYTKIIGNVSGSAGSKQWLHSGNDVYKTAGAYSYAETTREGEYQRDIDGGTVAGTVSENFSKFDTYESETKGQLSEGSDEWTITFGTALATMGYALLQTYEGCGSYSNGGITGTIEESGSYSVLTDGVKVKSTYNTSTKKWDDLEEGSITSTNVENFKDSGSGSNGNVTINDRTSGFSSTYTEKTYLDTKNVDYTLLYTATTTFDAVENGNTYNGIGGTYKKTQVSDSGLTLNASWTKNAASDTYGGTATRESTLDENIKEIFALGNGSSVYDTYTYEATDTIDATLTEKLTSSASNSFEDSLWGDSGWQQTSLGGSSKQSVSEKYTKSGTDANANATVEDYLLFGTNSFEETYQYDKMLQKNFSGNSITGSGHEHIVSSSSDCFIGGDAQEYAITNEGTGYFNEYSSGLGGDFYGGTGEISGNYSSQKSSNTNLAYTWSNGAWLITGGATTSNGFSYELSDTATKDHDTGTTTGSRISTHHEQSTVNWVYDGGSFSATSVSGSGGGSLNFLYQWNSSKPYERAFYGSTIYGTENASAVHQIIEIWNVSFGVVNGQVVNESSGSFTEVVSSNSSFSGNGAHGESETTPVSGTFYDNYGRAYLGTMTSYYERNATLAEDGAQSYSAVTNGSWSNTVNGQGQLVRQASADSVIVTTASGSYDITLNQYSYTQFDGSYGDNSNPYFYTYGELHTFAESEYDFVLSEGYGSSMTVKRHSDGGGFNLVSIEGTANGYGIYDTSWTSHSISDAYHEWEDSCGCGGSNCYGGCSCYYGGCSCDPGCIGGGDDNCIYGGYSSTSSSGGGGGGSSSSSTIFNGGYTIEKGEYIATGWNNATYDYTADWGWSVSNGTLASVVNHVTGDVGGTALDTWYREWGSSSGCSCSDSGYNNGCAPACESYDETLSYTGWKEGNDIVSPVYARWSPFSGSISYDSCCCCGSDCSTGGSFGAPGFSASVWDNDFSNGGSASSVGSGMRTGGSLSEGSYNGSNMSPLGPEIGRKMTLSPIGEATFDNYETIDVSEWLPPLEKPLTASLIVDQEPSIWDEWLTLDTLSTGLDILGFIPVIGGVADIANVGVSIAKGDWTEAGINAIGAIPGFGDAIKGGAMAAKVGAGAVGVVGQAIKHGGDAAKAGGKVAGDATAGLNKAVSDCKPGSGSCFTEGTQIVVGMLYDENDVFVQYVTVNIEDIKVGDWVYSYDTLTGEVTQKEVTATFVRESDHINYLTILDESGNVQVLETTDGHPFWVVTDNPDLERAARGIVDENGISLYHENIAPGFNGFWVEAKDLRAGDVFIGANGELSILISAERVVFPEGIKVYNFTVDGNHNYFVIAKCDEYGQTCVLVHNMCAQTKKPSKPIWNSESITPIHEQLKGTGQIAAFMRKNFSGHSATDLLLKSPAQIVQMLKDKEISAKAVKTIKKFFEGRDLRHGN